MSLQDELKQRESNRKYYQECSDKVLGDIDKGIEDLKQQIAEAEVTYSIGDRLKKLNIEETEFVIADVGDRKVSLICIASGKRYMTNRVKVPLMGRISQQEFRFLTDGNVESFTRTYDHRKQEKC